MEIKTIQYIECDEVLSLIDVHWAELSFAKGAENGSFHYFFCHTCIAGQKRHRAQRFKTSRSCKFK
jgi:hypothetical protein